METIPGIIIAKHYLIVSLFALFGGIAHAIEKVKKVGWKGWISFFSDVIVCIFFGNIFYQFGVLVEPKYAVILTSLGSFWGAKSFEYLKNWVLISIKANLK